MKVIHSLNLLKKVDKVMITFGKFETLHKGHIITLNKLVLESKKNNSKAVVICFKKSNYMDEEIKNHLLKKIGIDYLVYLNLENFKSMTFVQFINFLMNKINLSGIIGSDKMVIGYQKRGNSLHIKKYCQRYLPHLIVKYILSTKENIKNISSSHIYSLLKNNSFEDAHQITTIPFSIKQKIIAGKQLGRKIDYSTINLKYPKNILKIPYGVYATFIFFDQKIYQSMSFWGSSFNDDEEKLETHIFNFNQQIYGKSIIVFFIKKIREKVQIKSLEDLKKVLSEDEKITKKILNENKSLKQKIQKYF